MIFQALQSDDPTILSPSGEILLKFSILNCGLQLHVGFQETSGI